MFWPLDRTYPTNRCCISCLYLAALNVRMCHSYTHTHRYRPLRQDKKMHWQSSTLCIDRVQCYQLTWLCYVWHGTPLRCCIATDLLGTRPATESCAESSSSTHPRQDRSWSYLKFLNGKSCHISCRLGMSGGCLRTYSWRCSQYEAWQVTNTAFE